MNKKIGGIIAIAALVIGGGSMIAFQGHAQSVSAPAPVVSTNTSSTPDIKSSTDTDNIQDDNGATDKPDVVVSGTQSTSEHGEGTAADANEVEDAN